MCWQTTYNSITTNKLFNLLVWRRHQVPKICWKLVCPRNMATCKTSSCWPRRGDVSAARRQHEAVTKLSPFPNTGLAQSSLIARDSRPHTRGPPGSGPVSPRRTPPWCSAAPPTSLSVSQYSQNRVQCVVCCPVCIFVFCARGSETHWKRFGLVNCCWW